MKLSLFSRARQLRFGTRAIPSAQRWLRVLKGPLVTPPRAGDCPQSDPKRKPAWVSGRGIRPGLLALAVASIGLLFLLHSRYRFVLVVGVSMQPAFHTGDLLVIDKCAYQKAEPRRGDVVLARYRGEWIVKRVVGLPGEEVEVRCGHLYINSCSVCERYPIQPGWLTISRGRLFEGKFALLGDNRDLSCAQSVHAIVSGSQIAGKVVFTLRLRPRVSPLGFWSSHGHHQPSSKSAETSP